METKKKAIKTFGLDEATKLALSMVPKDNGKRYGADGMGATVDRFDVLFVTSDKNVFFKDKEGQARNHATRQKLELFTVENTKK